MLSVGPKKMKKRNRIIIALLVGFGIAGSRFAYESSMPSLVPYDAQGGIWVAYSLVVSGGTFILASLFCALALELLGKHMRTLGILCLLPVVVISGCTVNRMMGLKHIRTALLDAQDPTTSPERLRALVGYETGFGYEIDNRIASNPNTPADVLRSLHGKADQVGTEMSLARNPNTPDDILLDLAKRDDDWKKYIQNSLQANPRYKEIAGPTNASTTTNEAAVGSSI